MVTLGQDGKQEVKAGGGGLQKHRIYLFYNVKPLEFCHYSDAKHSF